MNEWFFILRYCLRSCILELRIVGYGFQKSRNAWKWLGSNALSNINTALAIGTPFSRETNAWINMVRSFVVHVIHRQVASDHLGFPTLVETRWCKLWTVYSLMSFVQHFFPNKGPSDRKIQLGRWLHAAFSWNPPPPQPGVEKLITLVTAGEALSVEQTPTAISLCSGCSIAVEALIHSQYFPEKFYL